MTLLYILGNGSGRGGTWHAAGSNVQDPAVEAGPERGACPHPPSSSPESTPQSQLRPTPASPAQWAESQTWLGQKMGLLLGGAGGGGSGQGPRTPPETAPPHLRVRQRRDPVPATPSAADKKESFKARSQNF